MYSAGTVFCGWIQRSDLRQTESEVNDGAGLMPRILHIEDDPANRLLVRKLLATSGFEVIDAVDGLDGIRKACSELPDLGAR